MTHPVRALKELVAKQAEDDGLWFHALYASEAYLQQELRKLHAAVEAIPDHPLDADLHGPNCGCHYCT